MSPAKAATVVAFVSYRVAPTVDEPNVGAAQSVLLDGLGDVPVCRAEGFGMLAGARTLVVQEGRQQRVQNTGLSSTNGAQQ